MESESPNVQMSGEPKSNRNTILYVVGAIVLCCCCVAIGFGGYYGYQTYVAAQEAVQQFEDFVPEIPTSFPVDPNDPNSPDIPVPGFGGEAPIGGLADDLTREIAWSQVVAYSTFANCSDPQTESTVITVTSDPDENGTWQEEWDVDCGDGTSFIYTVDYTTSSGVVTPFVQIPSP